MHQVKQHIAFKIFALLLVASLVTPSVVKFAHVFEHHKHIVCKGGEVSHIHQVDLDCEFYKFQLNNSFLELSENDNGFLTLHYHEILVTTYKFLNNHRQLSFSLRGPPVSV